MKRFFGLSAAAVTVALAGWLVNGAIAGDDDVQQQPAGIKVQNPAQPWIAQFVRDPKALQAKGIKIQHAGGVLHTSELQVWDEQTKARYQKIQRQIKKLGAQARELTVAGEEDQAKKLQEKIALLKKWKPAVSDGVVTIKNDGGGVVRHVRRLQFKPQAPIVVGGAVVPGQEAAIPLAFQGEIVRNEKQPAAKEAAAPAKPAQNNVVWEVNNQMLNGLDQPTRDALQELLQDLDHEADELAQKGRKEDAEHHRRLHRGLKQLLSRPGRIRLAKPKGQEALERLTVKPGQRAIAAAQLRGEPRWSPEAGSKRNDWEQRLRLEQERFEVEQRHQLRKIEHLADAAEKLRAGGLNREADELQLKAERMKLELEKRRAEQRMRNEHERLERERHALEHDEHEHHERHRERRNPQSEIRELLRDLRHDVRELRDEVHELHEFIEDRFEDEDDDDDREEEKRDVEDLDHEERGFEESGGEERDAES